MYKITQKLLFAHFNGQKEDAIEADLIREKMPYIFLDRQVEICHPRCYSEKIGSLAEVYQQHLMMAGDMMVITGEFNKDDPMDASRQYIAVIKLTLEDCRTPEEKKSDEEYNAVAQRKREEIEERISKSLDQLSHDILKGFPLN